MIYTHRIEVRFRDCDALGHVNHAVYFTYLEQARFALWRRHLRFDEAAPRGVGVILARAECDFKAEARYGDELEVRLSLAAIGRTSFTYQYEIVKLPDGSPVASARTVQVMFDYDRRRPVEIPPDLREKLALPGTDV
jgi:acyl-CoA thioester hydrolase